MVKVSKKVIMAISACSAALIATSTILANLLIKSNTSSSRVEDPLNRGNNYHHYSICNKLQANTKLSSLVDFIKDDKMMVYIISEAKFKANIKQIIRDTFKSIPAFSSNYLNYKVECQYKINTPRSVLVDLVWYEPNSSYKYFDQFELQLQSN